MSLAVCSSGGLTNGKPGPGQLSWPANSRAGWEAVLAGSRQCSSVQAGVWCHQREASTNTTMDTTITPPVQRLEMTTVADATQENSDVKQEELGEEFQEEECLDGYKETKEEERSLLGEGERSPSSPTVPIVINSRLCAGGLVCAQQWVGDCANYCVDSNGIEGENIFSWV